MTGLLFSLGVSLLIAAIPAIINASAKKQVVRSDTSPDIALMQDMKMFWQGFVVNQPAQPVGASYCSIIHTYVSIPPDYSARPEPAFIPDGDLFKKMFKNIEVIRLVFEP